MLLMQVEMQVTQCDARVARHVEASAFEGQPQTSCLKDGDMQGVQAVKWQAEHQRADPENGA